MRESKDLSVIITARNEVYLARTVEEVLNKRRGNTEVIVVFDGTWADPSIPDHKDVIIIYHNESIGQRAAINQAIKLSDAKFIMKLDAHCALDEGFDVKLMADCEEKWTVVPTLYNLHVFDWKCNKCGNTWYQGKTPKHCCNDDQGNKKNDKCDNTTDFEKVTIWKPRLNRRTHHMRFDRDLKFGYWGSFKDRPEGQGDIADTMSLLGACFFMHRKWYWDIGGSDEEHGSWGQQGTEIALKSQLSGGRLVVNKKTWYSHLFRTQGGDFGFPYPLSGNQVNHAREHSRKLWLDNTWEQQIYPLSWLVEKFWPIPGWNQDDLIEQNSREMNCSRSGIYSITNIRTKRIYIGSAKNIKRRFKEHIKTLKSNTHRNQYLQRTWDKYGEKDFIFRIEMFCKKDKLVEYEQEFIDEYREKIGWDNMFNIDPKASSSLGRKCSKETRLKIGLANSGRSLSMETRKKLSEALKNRVFTEEHKRKLVNSPRFSGHNHSEGSKTKIGEAVKLTMDNRARNDFGQFIKVSKGIIFYTDNQLNIKIAGKCKRKLMEANIPIVSSSLKKMDFGIKNIHLPLKRGYCTMAKQILASLTASNAEIIFFAEHDVLYHQSHFDFTPPRKDTFYYNQNVWRLRAKDGFAVHYDCNQLSGLCCYRELAVGYYTDLVKRIEKEGFDRKKFSFEPGTRDNRWDAWKSKYPNVDIRHGNNLTLSKWSPADFRNKKYCVNWKESYDIPAWGRLKFDLK